MALAVRPSVLPWHWGTTQIRTSRAGSRNCARHVSACAFRTSACGEFLKVSCRWHSLRRSNTIRRNASAEGPQLGDLAAPVVIQEDHAETYSEIVQGSNVILGEGDSAFQGYFIQALKNSNGVALLFLSDIMGFENSDNRDFAYRLACLGYNVLVPDLFRGEPWSRDRPRSEMEEWRESHPPDRVAGDIDVATEYLAEQIDAVGKMAVIGFCFGGGRLIETLARDENSLFGTGAFCYGTRFELSLADQVKVPLLLIAGDKDPLCSTDVVHQLEQKVTGSKAKIYPGCGHAFAHYPNGMDEDEAAEDAFNEIKHWLHERLIPEGAEHEGVEQRA